MTYNTTWHSIYISSWICKHELAYTANTHVYGANSPELNSWKCFCFAFVLFRIVHLDACYQHNNLKLKPYIQCTFCMCLWRNEWLDFWSILVSDCTRVSSKSSSDLQQYRWGVSWEILRHSGGPDLTFWHPSAVWIIWAVCSRCDHTYVYSCTKWFLDLVYVHCKVSLTVFLFFCVCACTLLTSRGW